MKKIYATAVSAHLPLSYQAKHLGIAKIFISPVMKFTTSHFINLH
jgi:hypothetical protein